MRDGRGCKNELRESTTLLSKYLVFIDVTVEFFFKYIIISR